METQSEFIKIKDGLYIGSLTFAQDYEFLMLNKFGFIVNCAAEIPNYFEGHGIKYLKFKLLKEKQHKLWENSLKKLSKMDAFLESCEEHSMCCLISSAHGNNRSLVMLTAYLMKRFWWSLAKTLGFIRSKSIFIGLSEHYITQLQLLEEILTGSDYKLSKDWAGPYRTDEEEIIAKTFINAQEIAVSPFRNERPKKEKRVTWNIKVAKSKKKDISKPKLMTKQPLAVEQKQNQKAPKVIEKKTVKSESVGKPSKKVIKTQQSIQKDQRKESNTFQQKDEEGGKYLNEQQILKIIKKNLKLRNCRGEKENSSKSKHEKTTGRNVWIEDEKGLDSQKDKDVYKLTINNFIQPKIKIVNSNSLGEKKKNKSAGQLRNDDQKIMRAFSNSNSSKVQFY